MGFRAVMLGLGLLACSADWDIETDGTGAPDVTDIL